MARKGQFKKGGGRVGSARRSRKSGGALVRYRTRTVTKYRNRSMPARRKRVYRRRGGARGGVTAGKLALAAIGLGLLTSQNTGPAAVRTAIEKVPGTKTFGPIAVAGLGLGAVAQFTSFGGRFRPWMRAAGAVGLVAAAIKLGTDNKDFKFVGAPIGYDDDDDDDELMDVDAD